MEEQNFIISELPSHLRVIETTSERNGYPANIRKAVIGFETYQEAEELAAKHGLEIEFFEKKDGWSLWYRTNNTAFGPMKNSADDYGDNCRDYDPAYYGDEAEFFEKEVREILTDGDFENFADVKSFLSQQEGIWKEISNANPDQIVIHDTNSDRLETIPKQSMYFNHDTKHIAIGII